MNYTRDAVRKAGRARLLDAMRKAAAIVADVPPPKQTWPNEDMIRRAYVQGAMIYASATVRAALLTAWGD